MLSCSACCALGSSSLPRYLPTTRARLNSTWIASTSLPDEGNFPQEIPNHRCVFQLKALPYPLHLQINSGTHALYPGNEGDIATRIISGFVFEDFDSLVVFAEHVSATSKHPFLYALPTVQQE